MIWDHFIKVIKEIDKKVKELEGGTGNVIINDLNLIGLATGALEMDLGGGKCIKVSYRYPEIKITYEAEEKVDLTKELRIKPEEA